MTNKKKALYTQIIEHYQKKIVNQEILPNEQLPTELEMAEIFGVSRITTKRALGELERAGLIYRKRGQGSFVLPVIKEKQIACNNLIAIVIPTNDSRGRRIDYIRGATDYLKSTGYYLTVHTTFEDREKERELLLKLMHDGIQGIIYYPSSRYNFDILYQMTLEQYPIVSIDTYFQSLPISYVVSDNFQGGYLATKHLIDNGHKQIAFMANSHIETVSSARERYFGYCTALKDNRLQIRNEHILLGLWEDVVKYHKSEEETILFYKETLANLIKDGVKAIFGEYDYITLFVGKVLGYMGYRVPEDISIIGYDNIEVLEHLDLPLTTIDQNFYEIGNKAAHLITEIINGNKSIQRRNKVPVKLMERESVLRVAEIPKTP